MRHHEDERDDEEREDLPHGPHEKFGDATNRDAPRCLRYVENHDEEQVAQGDGQSHDVREQVRERETLRVDLVSVRGDEKADGADAGSDSPGIGPGRLRGYAVVDGGVDALAGFLGCRAHFAGSVCDGFASAIWLSCSARTYATIAQRSVMGICGPYAGIVRTPCVIVANI